MATTTELHPKVRQTCFHFLSGRRCSAGRRWRPSPRRDGTCSLLLAPRVCGWQMTGTGAWVCKMLYICVKAGALSRGCEGDCYNFTRPCHVPRVRWTPVTRPAARVGKATFFLVTWFESSKMKFPPYFTMVKCSKHQKNSYKYLIFSPLTEISLTE